MKIEFKLQKTKTFLYLSKPFFYFIFLLKFNFFLYNNDKNKFSILFFLFIIAKQTLGYILNPNKKQSITINRKQTEYVCV